MEKEIRMGVKEAIFVREMCIFKLEELYNEHEENDVLEDELVLNEAKSSISTLEKINSTFGWNDDDNECYRYIKEITNS